MNNDGYIDLFVAKGNVEALADYAMRDPNNLLIGQADGTFVEGGDGRRHRQLRARPRRGAGRPQPRRPARPGRRQPPRERRPLAQRRGGHGGRPGADGQLAGGAAAAGGRRTATRSAPGSRSRAGDRVMRASSPSAAATPAGSSAGSTSASARRRRRGPGHLAGRRGRPGDAGRGRTRSAIIERGATATEPWQPPR